MQILELKYPSINAKLKAIYSKKLKKEEFIDLLKQPDSEKALLYLKTQKQSFKELPDDADRIEIETQLDKNLIKDIQKIERLLSKKSKQILNNFLSKYEIRCIKSVFRKLYSGSIIEEDLNNVQLWTNSIFKRIKGLETITNFEDFLSILKKTPYYKVFRNYENCDVKDINIFNVENSLDIMYFSRMMEIIHKEKNEVLKDIIGTQIDLQNITWIYRTKKYFSFTNEDVYKTLIKYFYKISKKDISELIESKDYFSFENILKNTIYKKLVTGNDRYLEQMAEKILYDKSKKYFRTNMFNMNFMFAYIDMLDSENNDITNIIEGIRYNLKREDILKKLVIDI